MSAFFVYISTILFIVCESFAGPSGLTSTQIANSGPLSEFVKGKNPDLVAAYNEIKTRTINTAPPPGEFVDFPFNQEGFPGVAIFDYDNDGDLDIYVTNGPAAPNALYQNQLTQTGSLSFVDVSVSAGVDATSQESAGVCYADTDNDGDLDLLVLSSRSASQRFFENNGDGTFTDKSASANINIVDSRHVATTSCTFADLNGDGLHDVYIGGTFNFSDARDCFVDPTGGSPNALFINQGSNVWTDESAARGIANVVRITWAVAAIDIDMDGDIDLISADDQCALPDFVFVRGLVRIYENDGNGFFTDVTSTKTTETPGAYMGLSFADFNHDGKIDMFITSFGDYFTKLGSGRFQPSEWWLQSDDGTWTIPGVGALQNTVFGWGTSAFDLDNDGDTDIWYVGGLDAGFAADASNPLAVLINDGAANFERDADIVDGDFHIRRNEQGSAMGDLNQDGFPDFVTVASFVYPSSVPILPVPGAPLGGPFDANPMSGFVPTTLGFGTDSTTFIDQPKLNGTLSVEIMSTNDNHWISIIPTGSKGLLTNAKNPRDGIGSIVSVTPSGGVTQIIPIMGGSSHLSQDAIEKNFGLGNSNVADVEIFWTGGVTNHISNVLFYNRLTVPEIPCDVKGTWSSFSEFSTCLHDALDELETLSVIDSQERATLLAGNINGFHKYH